MTHKSVGYEITIEYNYKMQQNKTHSQYAAKQKRQNARRLSSHNQEGHNLNLFLLLWPNSIEAAVKTKNANAKLEPYSENIKFIIS